MTAQEIIDSTLALLGHLRLGDKAEALAKPIARALKLPCLDEQHQLRPESPCAQRRNRLNGEKAKQSSPPLAD